MSEPPAPVPGAGVALRPATEVTPSLLDYEQRMLTILGDRGLPQAGVLVPVEQRRRLLANLDDALADLSVAERGDALYLSKFVMAVGAGLFDAALNYLWDETIEQLRRRVANYDLAYFFDLAVTAPDRRKKLHGTDDLPLVDDSELIKATNSMGLTSDVGLRQLDLVRYMRNYASAAHPNQNELTGLQLVGFLETCIREVITLPETNVVAEVRRLLVNVKTTTMDPAGARATAAAFAELSALQAANLGQGLFGIYVDPNTIETTRDNVRLLIPQLWPFIDDATKRGFGVRYARFVANGDQQQADFARQVLDLVNATSYLPETVRVSDIDEALDALITAHHGWNNFHIEPSLARRLQALVGTEPVPAGVRHKYVTTLVNLFLGSGSGVAWNADPIYHDLIVGFSSSEARIALTSYTEVDIASKLQMRRPSDKYVEMLTLLQAKFTDLPARELLSALQAFTGPRDSMGLDSDLRRLTAAVVTSAA